MAEPAPRLPRDQIVPLLAGVLALLVLPATGLAHLPWLPQAPGGYYALALAVCALFFLLVPPSRALRALTPGLWLLAALPFLVFGVLGGAWQRPGGWLPALAWLLLAAATWAFGLARRPALLSAAGLLLLGGGSVLATAGLPALPNPVTAPLPAAPATVFGAAEPVRGLRADKPVRDPRARLGSLAASDQPLWTLATESSLPGPRPVVLLLDGADRDPAGADLRTATIVPASALPFQDALDLLAVDALVVRSRAWPDDDRSAAQKAQAVAGFVRKGGLLIGPAPGQPWPVQLGRLLRTAGRGHLRGPAGARRFGLGRVARAGTQADVTDLLAADLWVPEVGSRLADPLPPFPLPSSLFRWEDEPAARRPQGFLLLAYAAALAVLGWLVRRRGAQAGAVLLAAGVVSMALVWITPREPAVRALGLVTSLGGPGGRRHEALVLSAGPQGYVGAVHWLGGGVLSLAGGVLESDGRLRIPPGRSAWLVREPVAAGPPEEGGEDRAAAFLRPLLLGPVDPTRLRYGRLEALPVEVEGVGAVPAWTLSYRAP